jgi:hypothetical protein
VKDVNNVHLACQNLHQIANLHVNPKFRFDWNSPKILTSLVESSRIFEELEFLMECDHLLHPNSFEMIRGFINFTGLHIKSLISRGVKVDPQLLQNLLDMLPNLEALELNAVSSNSSEELFKWDLKSTKIERLKMDDCTGLDNLLESLEKCAIKNLELEDWPERKTEVLWKFLKAQEKKLKKLKLTTASEFNLLDDLKDLRLEYLQFYASDRVSYKFLDHQVDLKILRLINCVVSDEALDLVCGLKNLETLELTGDGSNLNNLRKLENLGKLKRLVVPGNNILDHMKFGAFHDLEELDAAFEGASVEPIQEMSRITPNLKKLVIHSAASETINVLLETLNNLETVKVQGVLWESSGKVHPKLKHLAVYSEFKLNTEQFSQQFPNLEYLKIDHCSLEVTGSFFMTLLSGLKQLKTLYMKIWSSSDSELDPDLILQYFQEHGNHLEDAKITLNLPSWLTTLRGFAIEKRAGGLFCINETASSLDSSWMQEIF